MPEEEPFCKQFRIFNSPGVGIDSSHPHQIFPTFFSGQQNLGGQARLAPGVFMHQIERHPRYMTVSADGGTIAFPHGGSRLQYWTAGEEFKHFHLQLNPEIDQLSLEYAFTESMCVALLGGLLDAKEHHPRCVVSSEAGLAFAIGHRWFSLREDGFLFSPETLAGGEKLDTTGRWMRRSRVRIDLEHEPCCIEFFHCSSALRVAQQAWMDIRDIARMDLMVGVRFFKPTAADIIGGIRDCLEAGTVKNEDFRAVVNPYYRVVIQNPT